MTVWVVVPAVLVGLAVLLWPRRESAATFVPAPLSRTHRGPAGRWVTAVLPAGWRRSRGEPELGVPDVLDLIALALDAGASTVGALRAAADRLTGDGGRELRSVAAALEWGLPDAAAWAAAPPHWEPAGRALRLAARAGVPPAGLLRRAAEDVRRERLHAVESATARLGVRLVLPLGLAFLPAFVLTTVVPVVLALAGGLLAGDGALLLLP